MSSSGSRQSFHKRRRIFPTAAVEPESTCCVTSSLTLMASEGPTLRVDLAADRQAEAHAFDLELVRRAQAGDDQAFGQLVERNRRAVYRAAYAALGSAADADDVAQETFVTVYRKLHSYRGEAAFRTWLLSIAWRKALDRRRRITRWLRMTVTHDRLPDDAPNITERVASADRQPVRPRPHGLGAR